jgi:putative nucleotidyltransferase with HDIG domain
MMEFTGRQLPPGEVQAFWQHSFMTGMLSERVAKWIEYSEREQAYLGGLLHDVGMLPLLVVAAEENALNGQAPDASWGGSLEAEKNYFGLNHCEVGRWIGKSWNFFPSFIDVFENHHHPECSSRDPHLVGIVAAADRFSETQILSSSSETGMQELTDPAHEDEFMVLCFPRLDAEERLELMEMLENEYLHLLPVIEFNNPTVQRTVSGTV